LVIVHLSKECSVKVEAERQLAASITCLMEDTFQNIEEDPTFRVWRAVKPSGGTTPEDLKESEKVLTIQDAKV
jgi:hypothetical protein